ncbi:MAG: hypothetical protein HYR76_08715 [Ignavibacteria bacterium]|nr:hypothetical protein [Ignavibacteria bacterium]
MQPSRKLYDFFHLNLMKVVGVAMLFLFFSAASQAQLLTAVANPHGAPSSMTFSELQRIFGADRQRWEDGTKITIALMKTSTEAGAKTAAKVYEMEPDELYKFWISLVFRGKTTTPKFFGDVDELKKFVDKTSGAIGIVPSSDNDDSLKHILIDKKKSW